MAKGAPRVEIAGEIPGTHPAPPGGEAMTLMDRTAPAVDTAAAAWLDPDGAPAHDASWALAPEGAEPRVVAWVEEMAHLTTPDSVVWVDGSRREQDGLL